MASSKVIKKIKRGAVKLSENAADYYAKNVIAEELKEMTMQSYDDNLLNVVTDRNSKSNPNLYRDDFLLRLEGFEFIPENGNSITINIPALDNFDFSGRLRVIERIIHGTAGKYVEMNEDDYVSVFNKKPTNEEPIDEYVPPSEQIYLVRYTGKVIKAERELNKKFVKFPFSNNPPVDIFADVSEYVSNNMRRWTKEIKELIYKGLKSNYKGARM